MQIELGTDVIDSVTGFKGKTISMVLYLNGCRQFCVQPKIDKDGTMPKSHYIDEQQLKPTARRPAAKRATSKTGGGVRSHPQGLPTP